MPKWIATIEDDPDNPGELLLVFPTSMIEELGWEIGDTLDWTVKTDHSVILQKVEK